jgi:hypothetical protein
MEGNLATSADKRARLDRIGRRKRTSVSKASQTRGTVEHTLTHGAGDGEKAKYYQQTWTMTIIDGACAEIRWQGSDITVWGSRRFK